MDNYKLPYGLKKGILIDAIDSTRLGKSNLDDWADGYLFYQEVSPPGEREYVFKVVSFLRGRKCDFEPYSNGGLIGALMDELEEV